MAPYLYSPEEIAALVRAAGTFKHPLKALNYTTLIGLLACTGMRVGETCALDRDDVDLGEGVLTLRAGKLGKARQVPLHSTATAALRDYDRRRDLLCPAPSTAGFFITARGTRLSAQHVPGYFTHIRDAADIRPAPGGRNPRIHDLRHLLHHDPAGLVPRRGRCAGTLAAAVHLSRPCRPDIHLLVPPGDARADVPGR